MGMNKCSFSGTCMKAPKLCRSQNGDTYAVFSIAVDTRIKNSATGQYEEQCCVVECALFNANRVRFLCDKVKTGTRVAVQCYYMPVEIRDAKGKLKSIPMFVVEEWEYFSENNDKWHSPDWY